MNIQTFQKQQEIHLKGFVAHWAEEAKKDPKNWPEEMGEADWEEQLLFYIQSKLTGEERNFVDNL